MKAATPVEKDNNAHQSPSRKQRQQGSVVPLSEVETTNVRTQNTETSPIKRGSSNTDNNRLNFKGGIAAVHGSKTIYDQGSEIMYGKLQESLSQTGDINHPDTKEVEKGYMTTLSVNQINDYQNLKSETYLPKTLEEQAAAYQENKAKEKKSDKATTDISLANLSNSSATELAANFNAVQNNTPAFFNSQTEKATGELPKVNAKTGSAFSGSKPKNKANTDKTVSKSSKKTVKSEAQKPKSKEISFPQNEPLKKVSYSFKTTGNKNGELEKQATQQFRAVSLDTSSIPTTMQQNANVDLTGEADTEHLAIEQKDVAQDLSIKKNQAAKDIHKDHGENSIIKKPKDEILKPSRKIKSKAIKKQPLDAIKLEGIDEAGINTHFDPIIQSKIGAENEKYEAAELEHNQKVLEQEKATETQIGIEKDQSQEKQRKSVKDAQADVHNSKVEWQNALNKTESDFAKKSGDQAKTTLGNIKTEKSKGEAQAQKHINKANEDALKEKKEADRKAAEKKSEMEEKSGGFFGWLADKVSDFINALKDALNVVFTALRKAVKAIFEIAKKLVLEALEIARKAIVGFIKGFASLLKGFLDIALAAFPGIRDRLKAKIDKYVAATEKFVNQTFEAFKKAVVAIIDFLAETVDKLIGALQDFYNLILDAINFIVAGIIKIMEGLSNLVSSAMVMPDNFMGQISEEFLGMDVTQPLPFEKAAMPEAASSGAGSDSEYSDLLNRNSYDESDFHVDPVANDMELSPELLTQLQNSNGEINFGANENTLDTFKQDAVGSEGQTEAPTGNQNIPADPYAQADWFINYQNSQSPPSTDTERASGKQPTTAGSMSEEMKLVGPWTPGVRLYYLKEQMWSGIKKNWEENKWKYIGIGAAIVLGITALAILTAGAIFALIPPALEIFAAIMMAQAIAKASSFFKTFMTDGWLGKTATAGKALARAIGIILVELIFILLFDSAALFKVLKTAAKGGVKGVFNLAKTGIKSTLKAGKNALVATGKGFVKQAGKTRFFVQGLGKGIVKGAKNLDELGENLAKRFKFKGFKIVIKGFKFYLYGSVNPWVLLASGEVKEISDELAKGKKLGDEVEEGILVGIKGTGKTADGSAFVKALGESAQTSEGLAKNAKRFEDLKNIQDLTTRNAKILQGGKGVARDPNFRKNFFNMLEDYGLKLSENAKKFIAVHHIAPNFLKGKQKIADFITHMGYNIDAVENAIGLPRIDLNILDDAIKGLDESIDVLKNTKHLESIKTALKLGDDVDIKELRRIVKELEDAKTASVHAVDTYHPAFNKMMEEKIFDMSKDFDDLIKSGMSKNEVIDLYKPEFKNFYNSVVDDLLNGKIKL